MSKKKIFMRKTSFAAPLDLTNLMAYYRLNDNALDEIGTENGSEFTDSPPFTYLSGNSGNAGNFRIAENDFIRLSAGIFDISIGSLSCYIKTTDAGSGFRGIFVKKNAYSIFAIDGEIGFFDWGGAATRLTGVNIEDGLWNHIVLTFDSGVTNGTKIYINGVLVLTTDMTISNQTRPIHIGTGDSVGQNFNGLIDSCGAWDAILNQTRVTDIYNHQNTGNELV